ncbi:hypothetical protein KSS92_21720 [Pseudomonas atacamensis]|uniref:hypothetical protein n=1 Tax=Pseudomonas atacamensis TaxID=2565368 RepID=UPI001C3CF8D5|nr:hypothetical protein [Pseudomonas atacamensis]QXH71932.1 hypothetical protein KSS92_21720 [Pseudomonas atacamensis]
MSDHENPGSNSPEDGPFPEDHRPSQKSDDPISEEPGILVADLEYEAGSGSLLVDTTMDFKFRIPVNDGRYHKVHLDFHGADNYYRRITESAWLGGVWHSIRVEDLPESDLQVRVDGRWHYVDQWSRWTPRTLLVRKAARIASNRTVTTTVPGLAGKGSKITLVRPNSGTVLSTTTITNGYGNWTVTLLDNVPQGLQDFIIREEYGSTQGRYAGKASLTVLKPVTLTPLPQVINTQTPQFAGTGGLHQAMTRVDVYIKGTSIKVLADAKIEIDGSWGGTSTYTFAFGENYSLVASQRYDGATSVPSVQRNFYVIDPPRITSPGLTQTVDMTSTFTGTVVAGISSAVAVRSENTQAQISIPTDAATGAWSASFTLTPGPHSIVGTHTYLRVTSLTSEPFGIRVRTGKPTVTYTQANETITFSGTGHFDEKLRTEIEFTILESPAGPMPVAPPNAQVQRNGTWSTAVTGWKLGTYEINAVQKIRDNAGGWIDSLPLTFEVKNILPDVSDVQFTNDYQPTFSGKGFNGAMVHPNRPNSGYLEAPEAEVDGGRWSTKASTVWGPSFEREVHIKQFLDGHQSPNWFVLKVTIAPQAPGLNDPEDEGLSPRFSGTCWPDATVNIEYSDEPGIVHQGVVIGDTWEFRRDKDFAPDISHTVTVTQLAAQQTSEPASRTFIVRRPMVTPVITQPPDGSEVGRVVTVEGTMGMVGATLQLRDKRFGRPLGEPKVLSQDGDWSIDLSLLEFRLYTFDAQQTLDGRPSLYSDEHELTVVLLPPEFLQPIPNGKLPRTALLKGTGMRGGVVDVCLLGLTEPLLSNVDVDWQGNWQAEVTLPVGSKTIWARQRFTDESGTQQESKDSEPLHFDVVPAAPFIETPIEDDAIGQQVVVCGFGVPGDTVTVTLVGATRSEPASGIVQENRTWSAMLDASSLVGGLYRLEAVASWDGFESFETLRSVMLGTFVPVLDEPAAGRWVTQPVQFSGKGRPGVGAVVSWYNPDVQWLAQAPVVDEKWRGEATRALPLAGNWYRFRQTLTDAADDATMSDWADSARFEVEAARLISHAGRRFICTSW